MGFRFLLNIRQILLYAPIITYQEGLEIPSLVIYAFAKMHKSLWCLPIR